MFCCLKRESQIFFPGEISVISNRKNLFPQTTKNCQSTKFSWSRTVDFSRLCILFFTLNQRNVLNRTEDIFFSVLSVTLHKAVRKNFTMDSGRRSPLKKKNFSLQKNQISLNAISASPKFSRKILSMKREYFTVWISELGGIEQNRKHHLTVNISPWTHAGARAKSTNPFLAGNQINVIFVERAFYRLNQRNALNRSDDLIFLSIFRDATQDGKNLTMDSHRRIQKNKQNFSLQKNQINVIGESCLWRESIFPFESVTWAELNRTENIIWQ